MKNKILVLDDEIQSIDVILEIIENEKKQFEIFRALRAENAIKIALTELPDIILTDWEMPGMDGIDFIKQLKKNDQLKDIPVVMITGRMTSSENLELALAAGAYDYIRKPVDGVELMARIHSALRFIKHYKLRVEFERKNTEILEEKVKSNIRQLTTMALQVVNKNQSLILVKEELKKSYNEKALKRSRYEQLTQFIDEQISLDDDWTRFKMYFSEVDKDFFERLQKKYPDLTFYEQKLCAYYKMDLSTKQIASILFITPESAKKSRTRLRKHLRLTKEQDLVKFLNLI